MMTRHEMFNKNPVCIFWTAFRIAGSYKEMPAAITPNGYEKNQILEGGDYISLKNILDSSMN